MRIRHLSIGLDLCTLLVAFLVVLPLESSLAATAPAGTWRLFKDSDGQVPKPGAVVEISFSGQRVHGARRAAR